MKEIASGKMVEVKIIVIIRSFKQAGNHGWFSNMTTFVGFFNAEVSLIFLWLIVEFQVTTKYNCVIIIICKQ